MNILKEFKIICKNQNIIRLNNFLESKNLLRIKDKNIITYIDNYNLSNEMIILLLKTN
jgi:hypothetical protein